LPVNTHGQAPRSLYRKNGCCGSIGTGKTLSMNSLYPNCRAEAHPSCSNKSKNAFIDEAYGTGCAVLYHNFCALVHGLAHLNAIRGVSIPRGENQLCSPAGLSTPRRVSFHLPWIAVQSLAEALPARSGGSNLEWLPVPVHPAVWKK
jgi:hypothetical protein